ncbi:MAG: hypothetical protein ACYC9M_16005 [Desulfobulbaceae bacterium]
MNPRRAIRILMLSPIYFRLSVAQRRELVAEYCQLFSSSDAELANRQRLWSTQR